MKNQILFSNFILMPFFSFAQFLNKIDATWFNSGNNKKIKCMIYFLQIAVVEWIRVFKVKVIKCVNSFLNLIVFLSKYYKVNSALSSNFRGTAIKGTFVTSF